MSDYTYTKYPVNLDRLFIEIESSSITKAIDKAQTYVMGDQLTISFKDSLSTDEKNTLDGIIENHTGEPIIKPSLVHVEPANTFIMEGNAVEGSIEPGSTETIDFKIENHEGQAYIVKYLYGADFWVLNSEPGDYAEFQIVDVDNVLGYGENLVLKQYIRKRYIQSSGRTKEIKGIAPGEIPVGLYLRCIYHATSAGSTRTIYINYDIEVRDENS